MATLASLTVNDTGSLLLPKGTTAQRPGSPTTGTIRYNTTRKEIEFYNGSIWVSGVDKTVARVGSICYLDPGDLSSYSGSGSTITDLSGFGNSGTLNNSPPWTSNNGGYFSFNGSNQFISTNVTRGAMGRDGSWSAWARYAGGAGDGYRAIVGGVGSDIFFGKNSGTLDFGVQDGPYYSSFLSSSATAKPFDGTWHYFVYTHEEGVGKFYMDGYLLSIGTFSRASSSELFRFGTEQEGAGYFWQGDIGPMAIYNKALSKLEIVRNYNIDRARFGV